MNNADALGAKEILLRVEGANDCASDIRRLAHDFERLDEAAFGAALEEAMARGDQKAVGRLLLCAGHLGRKLAPGLLARCFDACEQAYQSTLAFRALGVEAIGPLLMLAEDVEQVVQRRLFALYLATRIVLEYEVDLHPAKKVLWKLEYCEKVRYDPAAGPFFSAILLLFSEGERLQDGLSCAPEFGRTLADVLPEHWQRRVAAHGAPVRRAVAKLGRNEACHCGSGNKYKKCCFDQDQKLRSDASEFEGITRSSLIENPGQVDDYRLIYRMRLFELKRIDPANLNAIQLIAASRRAQEFRAWELAMRMLKALEARSDQADPFDVGHYEDLLFEVLRCGDLAFARKLGEEISEQELYDRRGFALQFALLENTGPFEMLEGYCRQALSADEEGGVGTPLQDLFFAIIEHYPALGIVMGRALLATDQPFIDEGIGLDLIRRARTQLDLEPWGDVAESLLDWIEDRERFRARERKESEQAERVKEQLRLTRKELDRKRHELQDQEHEAARLGQELAQAEKAHRDQDQEARQAAPAEARQSAEEREEVLARLRAQVGNLKAEIGEQQRERRRLRTELAEERKRISAVPEGNAPIADAKPMPEDEGESPRPIGKILIPEYASAFTKHCTDLPPQVAADALQAIGDFAAHDAGIWRKTKPLERLRDHYRMRIGIDYRLLLRWKAGESLRILDIIPRADLEAWIKRHG